MGGKFELVEHFSINFASILEKVATSFFILIRKQIKLGLRAHNEPVILVPESGFRSRGDK